MTKKQKFLLLILWIAAILAFFFMSPNRKEINELIKLIYGVIL